MNQFFMILLVFPFLFSCVSLFKVRKIPLQTVDLETVSENLGAKIWQHDGFNHMSGLQINEKLNLKIKVTPKLLMASGETPAHLQTILKNYEHTFLTIKFSTMIGKANNNEGVSKIEPSSSSLVKATTEIVANPSEVIDGNSTEHIHDHKNEKDKSASSISTQKEVPKDTKAHTVIYQDNLSLKTKDSEKIKKLTVETIRTKRSIDISSQELLQIHKIIKMAKKTNDNNTGNKALENNGNGDAEIDLKSMEITEKSIVNTPTEVSSKSKEKSSEDVKNSSVDFKLTYKTWRASFDKNYRPPGFYFLVDDQVIFDNWLGVWDRPNVLGRVTPYSPKRTWNETEIQFLWEEPPKRDIKISFEWEPIEKGSYILIDNIEIFTFGIQQETSFSNPNGIGNIYGNIQPTNNNLTIFVVVKPAPAPVAQFHETSILVTSDINGSDTKEEHSDNVSSHSDRKKTDLQGEHKESTKDKKLADDLLELIKTVHHNNVTIENKGKLSETNQNITIITTTTTRPDIPLKAKEKKTTKAFDKTGLIVLIVFIVMGTLIMITLLYRKMKEDRNPNNMLRSC